jgi:hypothetical protein
VGSANYLTAEICTITQEQPSSVCSMLTVKRAAQALDDFGSIDTDEIDGPCRTCRLVAAGLCLDGRTDAHGHSPNRSPGRSCATRPLDNQRSMGGSVPPQLLNVWTKSIHARAQRHGCMLRPARRHYVESIQPDRSHLITSAAQKSVSAVAGGNSDSGLTQPARAICGYLIPGGRAGIVPVLAGSS